jgi:uncharacterized protein YjbI with pentapeptide repeats
MKPTLERTHSRFLAMGWIVLRLCVPALLAVAVLTVVASAPATARAPRIKKPGAPTSLTVTPVNTAIVVSWSAPESDGGSPITGYVVIVTRPTATCTTAALTCTVSGLKNGSKYSVRVEAENAKGLGPPARIARVEPTTAPDCAYLGPYANLEYCNLANVNLQGINLATADLIGVASGGITGTPVSLPANWSLVDGYLIGVAAVLTDADLSGAELSNADLQGSVLTDADLLGANLTGANLEEAEPTDTNLTDANLTHAFMYETNLTDATLNDANLTDAVLVDSTLAGANVAGATLTGLESDLISGTPSALPSGWILFGGYLIGSGASLSMASLVGLDASGMDLANINLYEATLTNANFTNTDLAGANMDLTFLMGATWSNTTCPDGTNSNSDGDTCVNNLG